MKGEQLMENLLERNIYESLSQKIYRILKKSIVHEELASNTRLLDYKIAQKFGVSRTPVREALQKLANDGFVTVKPNKGLFVKKISIKEVKEVLLTRGALLSVAAEIAANKITKAEIKKLEKNIEKMTEFCNKKDYINYRKMSASNHQLISKISENTLIKNILDDLEGFAYIIQINSLKVPGRLAISLKEHKDIFQAIKKGDSELANKFNRIHFKNTLENIIKNVKNIN